MQRNKANLGLTTRTQGTLDWDYPSTFRGFSEYRPHALRGNGKFIFDLSDCIFLDPANSRVCPRGTQILKAQQVGFKTALT